MHVERWRWEVKKGVRRPARGWLECKWVCPRAIDRRAPGPLPTRAFFSPDDIVRHRPLYRRRTRVDLFTASKTCNLGHARAFMVPWPLRRLPWQRTSSGRAYRCGRDTIKRPRLSRPSSSFSSRVQANRHGFRSICGGASNVEFLFSRAGRRDGWHFGGLKDIMHLPHSAGS